MFRPSKSLLLAAVFSICLAVLSTSVAAQQRAQQPDWTDNQEAESIFFKDAFIEGLKGERPSHWDTGNGSDGSKVTDAPQSSFAWSSLISSDSIENEIKRQRSELTKSVVQSAQFAAGGHRIARKQFTMLAMLFAVVQQYDGEVRWQQDAAAVTERFRNLAQASTGGDSVAFKAAKNSMLDLDDMIRGNRWPQKLESKPIDDWSVIANRRVLMRILEDKFKTIKPAVASAAEFKKGADRLKSTAEVVAVVGRVLAHDSMDDAGDDDYLAFCDQLQKAAEAIAAAVKREQAEPAAKATGAMQKTCAECHDFYRG